jgi:hypothetical protein
MNNTLDFIIAVEKGDYKKLKLLLMHGFYNINDTFHNGNTALIAVADAAIKLNTQIISMLLHHTGIDVNIQNDVRITCHFH